MPVFSQLPLPYDDTYENVFHPDISHRTNPFSLATFHEHLHVINTNLTTLMTEAGMQPADIDLWQSEITLRQDKHLAISTGIIRAAFSLLVLNRELRRAMGPCFAGGDGYLIEEAEFHIHNVLTRQEDRLDATARLTREVYEWLDFVIIQRYMHALAPRWAHIFIS